MPLPGTAGDFTSVTAGTGSLSQHLVQTAYDLFLRAQLNSMPALRQFVSRTPVNPSMQGDSIVLQKWPWFGETAITAAKTPLTEEADVAPTKMPATSTVTVTAEEYGFAVATTRFFANRTLAPFDEHKARAIADHAGKVIDELVQDSIKAGITETTTDGDPENALTSGDDLTAAHVREVVTTFRANNVPTWDNEFYVAVVHPNVIHDLREETGPGGWRVAKEYIDDSLIRRGEVGEFEGVRFVQNNRVRKGAGSATGHNAGPANTYNNYFFGYGGLLEYVKEDVHTVVGPVVDNLNRFRTLGWYADLGFAVYEPLAIQDVISGASLN